MKAPNDPSQYTMSLMSHLRELRRRLFICAAVVLCGAIASYTYAEQLFALLSKPFFQAFPNSPLIGTAPAEAWILKMKVSLFAGAILTSPILFFQVWRFVAPGLHHSERRYVVPFVFLSTLRFSAGAFFCYQQVLPLSLAFFFDEFRSVGITPTIKMGDHLSMTITAILGFGIVFEMPRLAFFLARAGVVDHRSLMRFSRHAVVLIFIVAAVLTPPDVVTQLLMAGPLILLYGVSIGVAYLFGRRAGTPQPDAPLPAQAAASNS